MQIERRNIIHKINIDDNVEVVHIRDLPLLIKQYMGVDTSNIVKELIEDVFSNTVKYEKIIEGYESQEINTMDQLVRLDNLSYLLSEEIQGLEDTDNKDNALKYTKQIRDIINDVL